MSDDFWARQRAKQQAQNPAPVQAPSSVPWWAKGTNLIPQEGKPESAPQQAAQAQPEGTVDGHDISRAEFLRGKAVQCDRCPPDPQSGIRGNMYRATSSTPYRCFNCGWVDGREIHDSLTGTAVATEGPARRARQVEQSGFHANPYDQSGRAAQGVDTG